MRPLNPAHAPVSDLLTALKNVGRAIRKLEDRFFSQNLTLQH